MMVRRPIFLLSAIFIVALSASIAHAGTYTNQTYGFTFEYPDKYAVKAESDNYFSLLDKKGTAVLTGEVEDIEQYPSDLYAGYSDPFEKFGTWRAMLRCDADGPGGSSYCPALRSTEPLTTRNGFSALELMLVHVNETLGDNPTRKDTVTGPLYLVDLTRGRHTVVLMLGVAPDERMNDKQKKLASSVLDTIKFAK